jgi:hypothetical protein
MMGRTDRQPRCTAPMPQAKEPCARMVGHKAGHKTRWAMDNQYRAAMGREPDPWAFRQGEWVPR